MNIETANRLYELRKKNGYSQEELAAKLGLSRQAVSKWERAEASPDTDNLVELAKLYGISLDELLDLDKSASYVKDNKEEQINKEEKNENAKNRRSRKAQNKSPDMQMNIFDEEEIPEKYLDIYLSLEKPLSREEIAQKINKNIRQVNELLTMMEIEGLIEQTVGNMFKRII